MIPLAAGFLAFAVPCLVGLGVHQQGINLLDDGLWLLGADTRPEPGTGDREDSYPGGTVFFDGKPAEGDLYFITF